MFTVAAPTLPIFFSPAGARAGPARPPPPDRPHPALAVVDREAVEAPERGGQHPVPEAVHPAHGVLGDAGDAVPRDEVRTAPLDETHELRNHVRRIRQVRVEGRADRAGRGPQTGP